MSQFKAIAVRTIRNPLDGVILSIASRFGDKSRVVEQFLKFSFVGLIGFVVDFGTLVILQATVLPPVSDLHVAIATAISFTLAVISNFTWNRYWTYPNSRSDPVKRQLTQFTVISVIGGVSRTFWIKTAYLPLGVLVHPTASPLAQAKVGTMVAQFIGVIVVLFWNFFANRFWTYKNVK